MLRTIVSRSAPAAAMAAAIPTPAQQTTTTVPATTPEGHKMTALHQLHVDLGGKMVPFAGWSLPVQYAKAGVLKEHTACRTAAAAFDVSHMGQLRVYGADREAFVEFLTVADVQALPANRGRLAVMLNDRAGIVDDVIVTRCDEHVGMVINAGRTDADLAHIRAAAADFRGDVTVVHDESLSLVALQGPQAAAQLAALGVEGLEALPFMATRPAMIAGVPATITRCGYTGEDGFEISAPHAGVLAISQALIERGVQFAGLGARDSLRMEAGMCLYGHELTEETNVVEACLNWLITKRRLGDGGFIGHAALQELKADPARTPMRRVGIVSRGACARDGATVVDPATGAEVGKVTSGCPSPTLGCNVAQAYVPKALMKAGTPLKLSVRGRLVDGEVAKMAFIPTNYYSPPK